MSKAMDLLNNRNIQVVLLVTVFSLFMIFMQDYNPQTITDPLLRDKMAS